MKALFMRLTVSVLILAFELLVFGLGGRVVHVAADSSPDSVTGHANFFNAVGNHLEYSVNAIRHSDGSVSGEVQEHAETPAGEFIRRAHGTVICFTVTGNIARIGGIVDHSTTSDVPPGTEFFLTVIDNGEGANDPPDQVSSAGTGSMPGVAVRHCTTGIARAVFPIDRGNIQVRPSGF